MFGPGNKNILQFIDVSNFFKNSFIFNKLVIFLSNILRLCSLPGSINSDRCFPGCCSYRFRAIQVFDCLTEFRVILSKHTWPRSRKRFSVSAAKSIMWHHLSYFHLFQERISLFSNFFILFEIFTLQYV